MGKVAVDDKYRVVLGKARTLAGIKRRDRLFVISFKGGVILLAPSHHFAGGLAGVRLAERRHEASRFMFRKKTT